LSYLSNVYVAAILVDLRVVCIEDGVVNACGGGDQVTIIVLLDYISGHAVLSLPSKAVTLANDKVVTCIIDDSDVDDSKLVAAGKKLSAKDFQQGLGLGVRGNIVGCRDTVTDIASLSGVRASAGLCGNDYKTTRQKKMCDEPTAKAHQKNKILTLCHEGQGEDSSNCFGEHGY
jgi:hypothetical protein